MIRMICKVLGHKKPYDLHQASGVPVIWVICPRCHETVYTT